MSASRKSSAFWMLFSCAISVAFAIALDSGKQGVAMGFPGIYFGTQCLMRHCDPYDVNQLNAFYTAAMPASWQDSPQRRQSITLYVNLPQTSLVVAPFSLLPLKLAMGLWAAMTVILFSLATFLIWDIAQNAAPGIAVVLACIFLANAETVFAGGNTAGIVVSLCVIAAWCVLKDRFVLVGMLCLGLSLAMKPHDSGLVWLYFLLGDRTWRRRALQAAAIAFAALSIAVLWVSLAAPHWLHEYRSNLALISVHGGINDPGPASVGMRIPGMVIDLQTVFSVIRDDPGFYNTATYIVCGALGLILVLITLRHRSRDHAWFALASASALTMLAAYHRPYDAKLLLLTIPPCAILWAEGGKTAWGALLLTLAGAVITGDLPLAILVMFTQNLDLSHTGAGTKVLNLILARPVPLVLLAIAVFYLWIYVRRSRSSLKPVECPVES
ncbi:MAG TPA: glycosyltransferase family 87 protein [Terracidiphilus sp.]|nr:glycosyltransferase family 87 protein [Terracidiphilus sp.]